MASIYRQPGKTGNENLKAVKTADGFSGNCCQSDSIG